MCLVVNVCSGQCMQWVNVYGGECMSSMVDIWVQWLGYVFCGQCMCLWVNMSRGNTRETGVTEVISSGNVGVINALWFDNDIDWCIQRDKGVQWCFLKIGLSDSGPVKYLLWLKRFVTANGELELLRGPIIRKAEHNDGKQKRFMIP